MQINVTDLGSGLSASYTITHCHFLCCGYVWKTGKPPPFCSAHSSMGLWTHPKLHDLFKGIPKINKQEEPNNTSFVSRFSHTWKERTKFLFFAISISFCWKQLSDIVLGVLKPQVCNICIVYIMHFIYMDHDLFGGWSIDGVHRDSPLTGLVCGPSP